MKCMLVLAALALQPVMITPVRAENLKVEFNTAWASRETLYVSQVQELKLAKQPRSRHLELLHKPAHQTPEPKCKRCSTPSPSMA